MNSVGQRIRHARLVNNISIASLASQVGISYQSIKYIEEKAKRSAYLLKIAQILQVDPMWLSSGKGKEPIAAYTGSQNINIPSLITTGDKIRYVRKIKGLLIKDVAKNVGVSPQAIQLLETTIFKKGSSLLLKAAEVLEIDIEWLMSNHNATSANNIYSINESTPASIFTTSKNKEIKIPVIELSDFDISTHINFIKNKINIHSSLLETNYCDSNSLIGMWIKDDYMHPIINQGDFLIADTSLNKIDDNKTLYIICMDKKLYLKKILKLGDKIVVKNHNNAYDDFSLSIEEQKECSFSVWARIIWKAGHI